MSVSINVTETLLAKCDFLTQSMSVVTCHSVDMSLINSVCNQIPAVKMSTKFLQHTSLRLKKREKSAYTFCIDNSRVLNK